MTISRIGETKPYIWEAKCDSFPQDFPCNAGVRWAVDSVELQILNSVVLSLIGDGWFVSENALVTLCPIHVANNGGIEVCMNSVSYKPHPQLLKIWGIKK